MIKSTANKLSRTAHPLSMIYYIIYKHPSDYPNYYVVRQYGVKDSRTYSLASSLWNTLEQARKSIPVDAIRIERDPTDDPVIVESWI